MPARALASQGAKALPPWGPGVPLALFWKPRPWEVSEGWLLVVLRAPGCQRVASGERCFLFPLEAGAASLSTGTAVCTFTLLLMELLLYPLVPVSGKGS